MKLTRKWWKQRRRSSGGEDGENLSLPTRDDFQPMDTREQEEMVRSFENNHTQQGRLWRSLFAVILVGYSVFMAYSIVQQAFYPWELRFHAYFMGELHPSAVIFADFVAIVACLLAVKGLLYGSRADLKWIWYSSYTGILLALFWLYYMLSLSRFHWDAIWLAVGPLSGAGICLYVDHLLEESLEDIKSFGALCIIINPCDLISAVASMSLLEVTKVARPAKP